MGDSRRTEFEKSSATRRPVPNCTPEDAFGFFSGRLVASVVDVDHDSAREQMVEEIDPELDATAAALRTVPRHKFVPEAWRHLVYVDRPLPIGDGQTISAPSIVADMCDHLALDASERTLEIGTGCGYHAAVAAEIVGATDVYTVEYNPKFVETARERLADLGYGGISIREGDGRDGWPAHAPYDKVYSTCAVREFPDPLIDQTRLGGLLLAPIGLADQRLVLAKKRDDGSLDRLDCGSVQFVPIQGVDAD